MRAILRAIVSRYGRDGIRIDAFLSQCITLRSQKSGCFLYTRFGNRHICFFSRLTFWCFCSTGHSPFALIRTLI